MPSPGRQEQIAAETAAIVNAVRMNEPLVVIAWPHAERAESHLSRWRANLASRPLTWAIVYFGLGLAIGAYLMAGFV